MAKKKTSPNKGKQTEKDFPLFRDRLKALLKEKGLSRKKLGELVGCSESTINTYLIQQENDYGVKSYKAPSAFFISKAAPILEVSTDYLLGLSDFRTPEADYIGKETGLREAAIKNLAADLDIIKSTGSSSVHLIDTLNYLASTQTGRDIVCTIYHYLFGNYTHTDADTDKMKLYDDTGIEANGAEISINDINSMFLFILNEKLTKAKKDIHIQGYGKFDPEADHTAAAYLWANVMPLAPTNNTK